MKTIKEQWDEVEKIKVFEFPVINKITGNDDWIIFDIDCTLKTFIATHIPLTQKETKSKLIAYCESSIDEDFSLDENLYELYDECTNAIIASDYFELKED